MQSNVFGNDSISSLIEPLILEIYLNNNNYKDRILINDLKKRAHIVKLHDIDESSFFVRAEEVNDIINTKFHNDLLEFDSTPITSLAPKVTSIYFIDSMIRSFRNLRYFRIHVSNSINPSRRIEDKIVFDYRIMHTKLDLANNCTPELFKDFQELFSNIGVYREELFHDKPFFEISAKELFYKILNYQSKFAQDDDEYLMVLDILSILGSKIEKDNSTMLIVMKR